MQISGYQVLLLSWWTTLPEDYFTESPVMIISQYTVASEVASNFLRRPGRIFAIRIAGNMGENYNWPNCENFPIYTFYFIDYTFVI